MSQYIYTEDQASNLLKRARRMQAAAEGYRPGLSKDELIATARESGIKSEYAEIALDTVPNDGTVEKLAFKPQAYEIIFDQELWPESFDIILEIAQPMNRKNVDMGWSQRRSISYITGFGISRADVKVAAQYGRTVLTVNPRLNIPLAFIGTICLAIMIGLAPLSFGPIVFTAITAFIAYKLAVADGNRFAKATALNIAERIDEELDMQTINISSPNLMISEGGFSPSFGREA